MTMKPDAGIRLYLKTFCTLIYWKLYWVFEIPLIFNDRAANSAVTI